MLIPNQNDRLLVSLLLKEIQDHSLQNILRKVFLGNRTDIFEVIQEERPETLKFTKAKHIQIQTSKK